MLLAMAIRPRPSLIITYDGTPPTPVLASSASDPTNAALDPGCGDVRRAGDRFHLADLLVDTVRINFTGSGTAYTFDVNADR